MSVPFSVRLDDDLKQRVDLLCKITERSNAYVTTKALEEYLARNQWKAEAIKKTKKAAKAGEFISQDTMMAWANSLGTDSPLPAPENDTFIYSNTISIQTA